MVDQRYLDAASTILENPVADRRSVRGTFDGRDVSVRAVFGTVSIVVAIDTRDDLLLEIDQRSWLTDEALEVHETVEVLTGDGAFDKAFHVEAAPTDVVVASLTDEVRRHLLEYPRCAVELREGELVERHRELDVAALEACVRAMIAFARSIELARDEVPKLRALPTDADGFRDRSPTSLASHDQAELELVKLAEMQRSRGAILIPASMVSAGAAYVTMVLWNGLPLVFLLLALPAALFGGIGIWMVASTVARGFRSVVRRRS